MPHLHKTVYESLPAAYGTLGAALLWASYRWRGEWWSAASAALGFIGVVLALVLWMHRRDYRATSADYRRRGRPVIEPRDEQR